MRRRLLVTCLAVCLTACQPLQWPFGAIATPAPASPTPPILQCTPPPCAQGEVFACPNGDCPGGCGTICATPTPSDAVTPTYPPPMCTPPPCWSNESYFCAGDCPGGCGTTCATHTPGPDASPPPTFPAPETVCALPASSSTEPAVTVCASALTVKVGETIQLLAEVRNTPERAEFRVDGRDAEGFGTFGVLARAENQTRDLFNNSATLSLVTVQASGTRLYLILEATAPGSANVTVSVAPPYPAVSAEPLTIVVAAP